MQAPARLRRRRLARAAHAADEHARQPRAAPGVARARRAAATTRRRSASALRSSRRMSRLVSDLLLLARADAGRAGARIECDLAAIAAAAVDEVEPVAGDHELSARRRRDGAGRWQPRRASPHGRQPARQRVDPHAADDAGRGPRHAARATSGARRRGRRPRVPRGPARPGLRALRARQRPRRPRAGRRDRPRARDRALGRRRPRRLGRGRRSRTPEGRGSPSACRSASAPSGPRAARV